MCPKRNRICILVCSLIWSTVTYCQQDKDQRTTSVYRNEIKVNIFNLAALQSADIAYEHNVKENVSIGAGVFVRLYRDKIEENGWLTFEATNHRSFSLSPYVRRYFSKGYAKGFFVEGFGMMHSGKVLETIFVETRWTQGIPEDIWLETINTYSNFAFGLSLGGKFKLKKRFLIELYFGVGGDPFAFDEIVTRGGLSLGINF